MISSQTASVAGSEMLPIRRVLLGKAGAKGDDAPSKKDLLAALGQTSDGDAVGATDKAARALSSMDGASDAAASQDFASAVAPFLRGGQGGGAGPSTDGSAETDDLAAASAAGGVAARWDDDGDGQVSGTEWVRHNRPVGGTATTSELPGGRLDSRMLAVLLQHQAA